MNAPGGRGDVAREPSGVPGFDLLLGGGLPAGRPLLVAGTAGSGKSVLAAQFIAKGVRVHNVPGVYVSLEEPPEEICENTAGLGFGLRELVDEGSVAFVNASLASAGEHQVVGTYQLDPLLHRINHAVTQIGARRVVIDGLNLLFDRFEDTAAVREVLYKITGFLKDRGITAIITAQRSREDGQISMYGVEEFVADGVLVLRNELARETRRRTVEILKLRGAQHTAGQHPFTIVPDEGIQVLPLTATRLDTSASTERITTGTEDLDEMLDGGLLEGSIALVTGPTGAGKTLLSTVFATGVGDGAQSVYFTFEESADQLARNAESYGADLNRAVDEGRLEIVATYPESQSLDQHFLTIKNTVEASQPERIVIDSLSALDKVTSARAFREFLIGLTDLVKRHGITAVFTASAPLFPGSGSAITEQHISTMTDVVIVLRIVERGGRTEHALAVIKMRGSPHDRRIRHFTIGQDGVQLKGAYTDTTGILRGLPTPLRLDGSSGTEPSIEDRAVDPR